MNLCFTIYAGTGSGRRFVSLLLNCLTMCRLPVPSGIESDVTAEKIIGCLCKINKGDLQDLPSNLVTDSDFFRHDPVNLPPGKSHVLLIYNMLIV